VLPVRIDPFSAADLAAVAAIEAETPGPWSTAQLAAELERQGGWRYVARRADGDVIGYLCGYTVADEAEILKLAVRASCRRQGVAVQLVRHALAGLAAQGVARVFLELRAGNQPARRLYEQFGFRATGVRKGYYRNPPEDAVLMEKTVIRGEGS
jgi:ribosomal-protein-alanine N-acetyltransferase